mmetsp:Transcript_70064/g.130968  ORF Transcript_70064/g.130968 Transcript_70064/m.130968 type:complete len:191 (+) Transcript_70064:80-652(+)
MDSHTIQKRSEDGICRLGMNSSSRLRQRALSASRVDILRQEQEVAGAWHGKLQKDMLEQKANIRALQKDLAECYIFGGPHYRHRPPKERLPSEYASNLQSLNHSFSDLQTKQDEILQIDRSERMVLPKKVSSKPADGVAGMSQWFAKYGEPKRKAVLEERMRTVIVKPRRLPFGGYSHAQHMRLGSAIWS